MKVAVYTPFKSCDKCYKFEFDDSPIYGEDMVRGAVVYHNYKCKHSELCRNAAVIAKMDEEVSP